MRLFNHNQPSIEISAFVPFANKDGKIVPGTTAKTAYLYDELYKFRNGYYLMLIEQLRSLKTKDEKSKYKLENLPAFTFSCHFKANDYRKQSNIKSLTNMICFDLDYSGAAAYIDHKHKQDNKYSIASLRNEIYNTIPCVFAGLSCTGTGIFFIVKYKPDEHLDCFLDVQDFFKEKYGIELDAACKDYGRLRFATHDPESLITNWDDTVTYDLRAEYLAKKKKLEDFKRKESSKVIVHHTTDVAGVIMQKAMSLIKNAVHGERHHKIRSAARLLGGYVATDYLDEAYVKSALMDAVQEINYDDLNDAKKTIDYGVASGRLNPLEINIITPDDPNFNFFIEQEEARQREIKNVYVAIREFIRSGVSITSIDYVDLAAKHLVDVERIRDIAGRLYEKFGYEFNVNNKPVISKVEAYLTGKYDFRRDSITGEIQIRQPGQQVWKELRYEDVWRDVMQAGFKFKFEDLVRVFKSAYVPEVNVWKEHFKSINYQNNGVDYIDMLASFIKCKNPDEQSYFQNMFKKMIVRCVKCAFDDTYANRTVLVLASEVQSNGKSSFIRWLNPFGPHLYYAENPLEDNKDSRIRLSETFIYNLEELSTISKFEINRLKAIISQIGTRDRKPYGRQAENIVRRCSFFGSTNKTSFLTDDKNTRWLCFEVDSIDWSYRTSIDKDLMWGQAYHLYTTGYDCELSKNESDFRDNTNERFQVTTIEGDLVERYFDKANTQAPGAHFLTSTSIHERLLLLTKESRIAISNVWIGRALSRLGFIRCRHKNVYGYWVYPKNHPPYLNFNDDATPTTLQQSNDIDDYEPPF